ncbi:MAG: ABC transporter substrate-binding protein [Blastochloris sp.]|nr:ABC transporter substrate-binding protein [Blastochloris sp.]
MLQRVTILFVLLALLAACGGAPSAPVPAPTSVPAAIDATSVPAAPVPTNVPAPSSDEATGFPRTISDFKGSVTIDSQPRRVIALNQIALQYLVPFLGDDVELIGYAQRDNMLPVIAAAVAGLPSYNAGDLGVANLELLLSWKPDIAFASIASDYYGPVAQVTTLINLPPARADSWRESTLMIGAVLDLEERAKALLAETDALIAAMAAPDRGTLAIAYVYNPGLVTFQTDVTPLGQVMEALGYDVAAPADLTSQGFEEISIEVAAERLDVDHLLVLNYGKEAVDGIINEPGARRATGAYGRPLQRDQQ